MNKGLSKKLFFLLYYFVFLSDVLCDPLWFNELYFTTKGPERKVIAQWAIIANGPDCRERGYHKVALRTFSTASDSFEVFFCIFQNITIFVVTNQIFLPLKGV